MKKHLQKTVSVLLAFLLLLCMAVPAVGAVNLKENIESASEAFVPLGKKGAYSVVEGILTGVLNLAQKTIPDRMDVIDPSQYKGENFYVGTDPILKQPARDAQWSLGYSSASLVPDDWQEHNYYLGGFIGIENGFSNKVEEIIDDMRVRVIALSDGSSRGTTLFGTIDAIGVSNKDIRAIRGIVAKEATKRGISLNGINVSSTHCHSCIDTQGLWTDLFKKAFKNIFAAITGFFKLENGADETYLSFLRQTAAETMLDALSKMTPGKLTYAVKDIGEQYFSNKNRKSASSLPSELHRFLFVPDDANIKPTIIANLGAHPDVAGLPTESNSGRALSGDYVYYIGEELEKHGYNFMFFNGAIAGIYIGRGPSSDGLDLARRYQISERYGREIARFLMAMTMTEAEILTSDLYDAQTIEQERAASTGYTLWCENWTPVTEREVPPLLNLRLKEVRVPVTNPLILLAGKLKLANYDILKDKKGNYSVVTEIGYLLLGDISVALVPGELVTDLYAGGTSLTKEGSVDYSDFGHASLKDLFGANTLCFGLTNDAIGYIVPDNDYKFVIFDDHYQESISLGKSTASTLMCAFEELSKEIA